VAVPLGRTASGTGAVTPAAAAGESRAPLTARARGLLGRRRSAVPAASTAHRSGPADSGRWPDPAELLLTALGPGPRLWERSPEHPDALTVRLGTRGGRPLTLSLREAGSLGLAGPRPRLLGLARALVAQLAVLHAPGALELVLVAADGGRSADARVEDWSWLPWLPHVRPGHGQPCRLLTGFDADQALARLDELLPDSPFRVTAAAPTVVVVDGDPGSAPAREVLAALVAHGPARGVHVLALAEHADLLPHGLGATAAVTGDVGTLLTVERPAGFGSPAASGHHRAAPEHELVEGVALDAVSAGWAGRLARALAPLREPDGQRRAGRGALPESARLLDVLSLGQVTPAQVAERWAEQTVPSGAGPQALVGVDRDGPCGLDLGGHLLIGGGPGSGRTELLRALLASLAVAHRPDRLGLLLIEGRPPQDPARGLAPATELPHVIGLVTAEEEAAAAAALEAELDRRAELLGERSFSAWHAERAISTRLTPPRLPADDYPQRAAVLAVAQSQLPHLVVAVDDCDAVRSPALLAALEAVAERGPRLGVRLVLTTSRPETLSGTALDEAAGVRVALRSEDARATALVLQAEDAAPWSAEELPGRAWVRHPDGGVTAFQAARITGRIPRTATQRPTVTPLDWTTAGDPPTSRPLRELGNGPTDLALLASALQRATDTSAVSPLPALF
jgi:S-DNA-T family DNA segregation ATPase FtsK/SpoIIIE